MSYVVEPFWETISVMCKTSDAFHIGILFANIIGKNIKEYLNIIDRNYV